MIELVVASLMGAVLLVASTDQFVMGASRVAADMRTSPVLVGAVILGCGTGLPELALSFRGSRVSPIRELLGLQASGHSTVLLVFVLALSVILCIPVLFPDRLQRHSPLILATTIVFAASLRGSLDRYEGVSMLVGFVIGLAWTVRADSTPNTDPFRSSDDEYDQHGVYIETPVITPVQIEMLRLLCGLLGTMIGAQLLGRGAESILKDLGYAKNVYGLVFVTLGSLLPHLVVALQALRQHHRGLAVGNFIGTNLFHSLAIGGLVAIIRPYQPGGSWHLTLLVVMAATAVLVRLILQTDDDLPERQGLLLLGSYIVLVLFTVT